MKIDQIDKKISQQQQNFKKQRLIYLQDKKIKSKQAKKQLKKQFSSSSSSDSSLDLPTKTPIVYFNTIKDSLSDSKSPKNIQQFEQHSIKTNSSKKSAIDDIFLQQRLKYKNQRIAYKIQAKNAKKRQYGSSSSQEDQLPIIINPPILQLKFDIKQQILHHTENIQNQQNKLKLNIPKTIQRNNSVRLRGQQQKRTKQRYQIDIPSHKGIDIWIERYIQIQQNTIDLDGTIIAIYDIDKIKLLFSENTHGLLKMKISVKNQQYFLAASNTLTNQYYLQIYYYIFAKIITNKLDIMGKKKKISLFSSSMVLNQNISKGAHLSGRVRKLSFFGGWQNKIGVFRDEGLIIYNERKQKLSLKVQYGQLKQLWTRFDFDEDNLIIKFINKGSKVQLSIPLQNYISKNNWLYNLYKLASKKQKQ